MVSEKCVEICIYVQCMNTEIRLQDVCSNKVDIHVPQNTCSVKHIAILFTIAPKQKQYKYPSTKQINTWWASHNTK